MKQSYNSDVMVNSYTELQNHRIIGWKRPLRSSSPTVTTTPPCLLNHVPKRHIYRFFEHLQGWGLHHFPRQPVPMSDHSFRNEIFPIIQPKPPPAQREAISSHPISSYLGKQTDPHLASFPSVKNHPGEIFCFSGFWVGTLLPSENRAELYS